jgi:hypothetical protein
VLLVAFAAFCATCILSTLAVYAFFFQSTVPMLVTAQPARGTFGFTGPDFRETLVRDRPETMSVGNAVRPTEAQSQIVVTVRDPNHRDQVVAMLTLKGNGSSAVLRSAFSPRFDWGNARYQLIFDVSGDVEVLIGRGLNRDISLDVFTVDGSRVNFGKPGRYALAAAPTFTTVTNFQGEAVLIPAGEVVGWPVAEGAGSLTSGPDGAVTALELPRQLLSNTTLAVDVMPTDEANPEPVIAPTAWGCDHINDLPETPIGRFYSFVQDGRSVLQLVRSGGAANHGETFCRQGMRRGAVWHDLTAYNYLALKTTFMIRDQSVETLSACGSAATECPLMVIIDYITEDYLARADEPNAQPPQLVFGFYAEFDPTRDNLLRCSACHQDHIFVQRGSWYTYESGNLFDLFVESDARPLAISQIKFYASGHEYDVRMGEIALLAAETTPSQAVATR